MARQPANPTKYFPQYMDNLSFDDEFRVHAREALEYDGTNLVRKPAKDVALKVTVSGTDTYVAIAAPGSAQSSAVWQAKKIDEATGTVVTWADGNGAFDNVATDLTALTYS